MRIRTEREDNQFPVKLPTRISSAFSSLITGSRELDPLSTKLYPEDAVINLSSISDDVASNFNTYFSSHNDLATTLSKIRIPKLSKVDLKQTGTVSRKEFHLSIVTPLEFKGRTEYMVFNLNLGINDKGELQSFLATAYAGPAVRRLGVGGRIFSHLAEGLAELGFVNIKCSAFRSNGHNGLCHVASMGIRSPSNKERTAELRKP